MRFENTLIVFLILLVLLALVHQYAMAWSLYKVYPWFDIPMHFWGGALVGLGTGTALFAKVFYRNPQTLFQVMVWVLFVGGVWEVFEWYAGIAGVVTYLASIIPDYHTLWVLDTVKDLVFDLCGGFVGYRVAIALSNNE